MSVFDKPRCPVCNSEKFKSSKYYESMRLCEEHSYCDQCGYTVEMAYGPALVGFMPSITKGHRSTYDGRYYPKNVRKRARLHKKFNIKRNREEDRILTLI